MIGFGFIMNEFQRFYNVDELHYGLQYKEVQSGEKSYDGIIIGSSHLTHSMMPSMLDSSGIHFYNFALNGANPEFYYHWYNDVFLNNHHTAKHCIIGIDWFMFDTARLWRRFEQDAAYFKSDLFYRLCLLKGYSKKSLMINRFPLFKYRETVFQSLMFKKGDTALALKKYDRGYIPIHTAFDARNFKVKTAVHIDTTQVSYFTKLISLLQANHVQIIFVMTPEYGIPVPDYEHMKSLQLVSRISAASGIPFLNFNTGLRTEINDHIEYFADFGHMNEEGSKVFSRKLSGTIDSLLKAE